MKRILMAMIPCCLGLSLVVGCGSDEPVLIESTVSAEDDAVAKATLDEYNSPEYAKAMAEGK